MDMEQMFINGSNMHYITSNEWIGKLVEEVVVAYFKELSSTAWVDRVEPHKSLDRTLNGHLLHSSKEYDHWNWLTQCMNLMVICNINAQSLTANGNLLKIFYSFTYKSSHFHAK